MPDLEFAAEAILTNGDVAVVAVVDSRGCPIAAAVHYALDSQLSLLFKSRLDSDHIRALDSENSASVVIYWHGSSFSVKAGVQLQGRVHRIADEDTMQRAVAIYGERFPEAREKFDPAPTLVRADAPSTLYLFKPERYKVVDNRIDRFDRTYTAWPT